MSYRSREQARTLTRSYRFLGEGLTPSGCSRILGCEIDYHWSGEWKRALLTCCIFGFNPCMGLGMMDGGFSAQFNGEMSLMIHAWHWR